MTTPVINICRECRNAVVDKSTGANIAAQGYRSCAATKNDVERATYFRGDTPCSWPERFSPKVEGIA